jgi:ATP-dependent RNA circularization protein (DNA/RNA ligase family)
MSEYNKIETLFERNPDFTVDTNRIKMPVLETINRWQVAEKIDGTNIRIMLDEEGNVKFGGRTNNAQLPALLLQHLHNTFTKEKMLNAFSSEGHTVPNVVLYGEGYGGSIQKMGEVYGISQKFRLFDVLVNNQWWLSQDNINSVAEKLEISTAPYLGEWTFDQIVERVRKGVISKVAYFDNNAIATAEGVVARPIDTLFDRNGKRIIIKLKTKDFVAGKK